MEAITDNWESSYLAGGITRSITEDSTKFLGKTLKVSLSTAKRAATKKMCDFLSQLLSMR